MSQDPVEELVEQFLAERLEGSQISEEEFADSHAEYREAILRRLARLRMFDLAAAGAGNPSPGVPRRFDGFELVRELGRGGMGVVYEAHQPALHRSVALKLIASGAFLSPRLHSRFQREIKALARISHPGIVKVFGSGTVDGAPYVVMELLDGEPLSRRLPAPDAKVTSAHVTWSVRTVIAVARALDEAHECGIVHRDVKPANVMIRRDDTPVLLDFGLALESDAESLTISGDFVGTLAYTAPEQARGERVDRRADVFGAGSVLYHLLTGRAPYAGRTLAELVSSMEAGPARRADRLNPALGRDLCTVLEHALASDPLKRYASCADFADDLERALERRPIRAQRIGWIGQSYLWARRKPAAAAMIAVAALALILGGRLTVLARERRMSAEKQEHARALDQARSAAYSGRSRAAEEMLSNIVARWPNDFDAWALRIESALRPRDGGRLARIPPGSLRPDLARSILRRSPPEFRAEPCGVVFERLLDEFARGVNPLVMRWDPGVLPALGDREQTLRLVGVYSRLLGRRDEAVELLRPWFESPPPDFATSLLWAAMHRGGDDLDGYEAAVTAHVLGQGLAQPAALLALGTLERVRPGHLGNPTRDGFDPAQTARIWRLFDEALEADPDNPAILQKYAYALGEVHDPGWDSCAEALLRRAIEVDPEFAVARWSLVYTLENSARAEPHEAADLLSPIAREYGHRFDYWRILAFYRSKCDGDRAAVQTLERGKDFIGESEAFKLWSLTLEYRAGATDAEDLGAALDEWNELWQCAPDDADGMWSLFLGLAAVPSTSRHARLIERCNLLRARGIQLTEEILKELTTVGTK